MGPQSYTRCGCTKARTCSSIILETGMQESSREEIQVFRVTRRYEFAASHRLHSAEFSEARNRELYGKCNNPYGHGHNYAVEVSVRGPVDEITGRAVDPRQLDDLVDREVLQAFDHRN